METLPMLDADCSALAGLFQMIVTDLKNSSPMWDDLLLKASKLHHSLKSTLSALSLFLDAFQRVADAATGTRGATKDVGAALTRLALRHRAIESRVRALTNSLIDCFVTPLQEKLEDWRKTNHSIDKDHTKEYKKARVDIKKRSDTVARLHKKARKVGKNSELHKVMESTVTDLVSRYGVLQESERNALRLALTEERSRFCTFAVSLKPVLEQEVDLITELGHLKEVMTQLERHSANPEVLPAASEQILEDARKGDVTWAAWKTPPSSPTSASTSSSLGSRKSSMCSISSINSSNSNSSSSAAHSPSHPHPHLHAHTASHGRSRSISQGQRLISAASQDSGYTSQDTLHHPSSHNTKSLTLTTVFRQTSGLSEPSGGMGGSDDGQTPSPAAITSSTAIWPSNLSDGSGLHQKSASATGLHTLVDRPHTISSAYERGRERPPLTIYTFQPHDGPSGATSPHVSSQPVSPVCFELDRGCQNPLVGHTATISRRSSKTSLQYAISSSQESLSGTKSRPPVPLRCSSLERPSVPEKKNSLRQQLQEHDPHLLKQVQLKSVSSTSSLHDGEPPSVPDFNKAAPDMILPQPIYSNMAELEATDTESFHQGPIPPSAAIQEEPLSTVGEIITSLESDGVGRVAGGGGGGSSPHGSLTSSGYGSQPNMAFDHLRNEDCDANKYCTLRPQSLLLYSSQESFRGPGSPRSGSLRRGQKPPPPIRRTSSISSTSSLATSSFPTNHSGPLSASASSSSLIGTSATLSSSPAGSRSLLRDNYNSPVSGSSSASASPLFHIGPESAGSSDDSSTTPVGSLEDNLPPPPAFLLHDAGIASLPVAIPQRSPHDDSAVNFSTTPEAVPLGTPVPPNPIQDECLQKRTLSVSQAVKSLQDIHHQPVSPVSHRKASANIVVRPSSTAPIPTVVSKPERRTSLQDTTRAALITSLNNRLAGSHKPLPTAPGSFKQSFRGSVCPKQIQTAKLTSVQEAAGERKEANIQSRLNSSSSFSTHPSFYVFSNAQSKIGGQNQVTKSGGSPPVPILKTGDPKFLQNLSMVLSQQQHKTSDGHSLQPSFPKTRAKRKGQVPLPMSANGTGIYHSVGGVTVQRSGSSVSERAYKVRHWISLKTGSHLTESSTASLRESLLDQIRRGTTLRRAKHIHDRSAPRVH